MKSIVTKLVMCQYTGMDQRSLISFISQIDIYIYLFISDIDTRRDTTRL